jgi:hypothetical protein
MPTATPSRTSQPRKRRVRLNLNLHPGQREVYDSPARFKVVACGRQWGKSRLGSAWALERALKGKGGWWVAPDANVARIGWDLLKGLSRQIPDAEIAESTRIIQYPGGGWVQVKGAHNEGKLRGVTLDFLVVDEAAFIPSADRWNSELRPTLAVKGGEALFISTFDGFNWFHDLYQLGQDTNEPEWESWRKPSTENPYFPQEELELARRTTPKAEFEQEYLASPLSRAGAVFPGPEIQDSVERGTVAAWREDLPTYAGLDWGYAGETAFEVCQEDVEGAVYWLAERRWRAVELTDRCTQIAMICAERGVEMIAADAAGATENRTLAETLARFGLNTVLQPVPFNKYKAAGIQTRRWHLERGLEAMAPDCAGLIEDTRRYHYKEGTEDVVKESDHTVDAATAFYATRAGRLVTGAA